MSPTRFVTDIKRLTIGRPIHSGEAHRERLSRVTGLAVLSSDALSSVAYAPEAILLVLVVGGRAALSYATTISVLIATLLAIVAFSYRQTIHAYPGGGGAYIVAKENLGQQAGLLAAASLLIDYVLTVAVSIAAGVAAITSAFPRWHMNRVELSLAFLLILAIGNLRGVRESGRIFAVPTYFFVASLATLVVVGSWRYVTGSMVAAPPTTSIPPNALQNLTVLVLLTAFSDGCAAMTGVEAVSNGVPAFRPPEPRNAASTLVTMAAIAITMFVGVSVLANAYGIVPNQTETVVSQLARQIFGGRHLPYYLIQAATMLILVLAANTAYADFPRLASILSRDRFLPRQFMTLGDRLAFSNGIVMLSVFAGVLLVVFGGDTHALLPLYMVGVFVSFTLSQAGMVRRWSRLKTARWQVSALINGVGALVTLVVLVIVVITKTPQGAWMVIVLIPVLMLIFSETRRHYDHVAGQLTLRGWQPSPRRVHTVVVPIGGLHRAVVQALQYASMLSTDVRAVYVDFDARATAEVQRGWDQWGQGVQLVILPSPYRSLLQPLLDYVDQVERERPNGYLTVVLPEFVPARWWQHLLHNQRALIIKTALLFRSNVIVTNVPYHLSQ